MADQEINNDHKDSTDVSGIQVASDSALVTSDSLAQALVSRYQLYREDTNFKMKHPLDIDPHPEISWPESVVEGPIGPRFEKSSGTEIADNRGIDKSSQKVLSVRIWENFLIVFLFFLVGYIFAFGRKRLSNIFRAFYIRTMIGQLLREEKTYYHRTTILLSLNFLLAVSYCLYLIGNQANWVFHTRGISYFISTCFLVILIYAIKVLLLEISANLFEIQPQIEEYVYNIFQINWLIGLILLPFIVLGKLTFLLNERSLMYIVPTIISFGILIRLSKALNILSDVKVSKFYLFLYLCTFEILPLIVLISLLNY